MGWFERAWGGFAGDFFDADPAQVGQIVGRLAVAALVGAVIGFERERRGKAAGLRTHMLVSLAAAFFVVVPMQAGMTLNELSRIVQGLTAGVGFLGAGAIIKQSEKGEVIGLTTAASLYFATAAGLAAGLGREVSALLGTGLAVAILTLAPRLVGLVQSPADGDGPNDPGPRHPASSPTPGGGRSRKGSR